MRPTGSGKRRVPPVKGNSRPPQPEPSREAVDLIIDCKFGNELPKPPVPKLLRALPNLQRLCEYKPTSLELDHRPFLLSERDLLSRIEIVDPDAYGEVLAAGSMPPPPPPIDAQLLRDDDLSEEVREAARKRARLTEQTEAFHRQAFGLQLPQLITNDVFTERQRFTTGLEAAEKKMIREPPGYGSVEELAEKIERTFEAAAQEPVHPSNPSMKARRILPVVPDAVLWANRYLQIAFDELPRNRTPSRNDLLFRTTPNPRTTCFGYFAPESEEDRGEAGIYNLAQNYFWDNRGGFARASDLGEGEALILSFPTPSEGSSQGQEVRFFTAPTAIKLKKQKAQQLDIELETQALNVSLRDASAQEAGEEQERINVVLTDEGTREHSEASLDYVEGEWLIRGDPRSASGRSRHSSYGGRSPRIDGADGVPLPLAASPASQSSRG